MKEKAFESFCTANDPTTIGWSRDGKNNKLVVWSNGVVLKRSIAKATIGGTKIQFWKRNGAIEEVPFDWVSMK